MAVHRSIAVGVADVERAAVTAPGDAGAVDVPLGRSQDFLADDELRLQVVARVEMSLAQFAERSGQDPFVDHGGGEIPAGQLPDGFLGDGPCRRQDRYAGQEGK